MRILSEKILLSAVWVTLCCSGDARTTTFVVTTVADTYPAGRVGQLRWAIQQVNRTSGTSRISFKIPGKGPFVIKPSKDLAAIRRPVTIDGYSQPGSSVNTLATGDNARLRIVVSGNSCKTGNAYAGTGNGLYFARGSSGSVVKGLSISGWVNTGILVYGAHNISICGNFIGTNTSGSAQIANQAGIYIESSNNTVIGSASPADRNIIAGSFFFFNQSACIGISDCQGTIIKGNYIGTNAAGTAALGNSLMGVSCSGSIGTVIGGVTSAERNIISGHLIASLSLEGSSATQVIGNYIGTNVRGTIALGKTSEGISLFGDGTENSATNNSIINNVISGNYIGIKLGSANVLGANQNTIQNNYIGTDYTGASAIPNKYGIIINDDSNTIGGVSSSYRNVIAGNSVGGILIYGGARNNVVRNNYIGYNSALSALANGYGVRLGLAGGNGAAGTNTITGNSFGGGNSVTNMYP